ncbi:MAG: hypothetical protein K6E94_05865 [Elusimicrobiaceae bacterium]|nr:hypothetical protein [Elusimicrobiaceae bacterium]
MKLKQLLKKTEFKYFILLILLIILALPFIFQEEEPKKIFSKGFFLLPQEDAALPVYPKGNAPIKPAKKLKDGFVVEEEPAAAPQNVIQKIKENIKANNSKPALSRDFLFMDEEEETAPSFDNSAYYQNEGNYNYDSDTMLTKNSANIIPVKDGYYHDGKFYKEGTYPPNANKKAIDRVINNYHNTGGQAKGNIPNTKSARLTPFGNNYPTARGLEKDSAYKPFPSNWDTLPTIVKAENFKDAKAHEGGSISSFNNRDNWPNGYYDNYNPYTLNMHAMYDAVSNGIKDMVANNFYNIERPDGAYGSGNSSASSTGSSSLRTTNSGSKTSQNSNDENDATNNKLALKTTNKVSTNPNTSLLLRDKSDAYDDISEDYIQGLLHNIACNAGSLFSGQQEINEYNIMSIAKQKRDLSFLPGSCPNYPVSFNNVSNTLSPKKNFETLQEKIINLAAQNDETNFQIVSTDRTVYPTVKKLNDRGLIVNKKGEPVTVTAIGPRENESNITNALQDITSYLVTNQEDKARLNKTLDDFYWITQLKSINTMLAFPGNDESQMIVLEDPNNSYWLKNPERIKRYPSTTLNKDGVIYKGFVVDRQKIKNILEEQRTNLIYVSGNNTDLVLSNGSVIQDITEQDYSITSLDPIDVEKNIILVGDVTKKGYGNKKSN